MFRTLEDAAHALNIKTEISPDDTVADMAATLGFHMAKKVTQVRDKMMAQEYKRPQDMIGDLQSIIKIIEATETIEQFNAPSAKG